MLATVPLAVSIVGILSLLGLKALERKRGKVFFGIVRKRADEGVLKLERTLTKRLPELIKELISSAAHYVTYKVTALALMLVRFVERRLTRFVNFVKGRREVRKNGGTRSRFLRDVTSHRDEVRRQNGYHPPEK